MVSPCQSARVTPNLIRQPCFDSALAGSAQHERLHVCPERSEVAWPGAGNLGASAGMTEGYTGS